MVSAPARRIAALYAMSHGISQRRTCALMHTTRANLFYVPTLPQKHAPTVLAMRRLSAQYPRYGSRRIHIFLGREEINMGYEQCRRLWAKHGLQVPKKRARKRVAEKRPRVLSPAMVNAVWSDDFIFDACANAQQLKCLTIVDEYSRESLASDVAGSIRAQRV